jgi:ribosomal protein S18 acetylase RimI-like enzyme
MKNINTFSSFMNETTNGLRFIIDNDNNKFKLFLGDDLVSGCGFSIEVSDEWFNEEYLTIYDLFTISEFRQRGYAKYLLDKIFNYTKNGLNINIICLIVDKVNIKAMDLYFKSGFEVYVEYDDSYSLVKRV